MQPRLLDLFCGAGGAARGYAEAGFDVTGVDIAPQKHYPYRFVQGDALAFVREHGHLFDVIHASPPCQRYSAMTSAAGTRAKHPDLIGPLRDLLRASGKPYIIENVPGAPLENPVMLCGTMFGLKVYRHRLFESNVHLYTFAHKKHTERAPRAGRGANEHGWISVAGHISNVAAARAAMGIDWMTRDELAQAIPPAYTRWLGDLVVRHLHKQEREEVAG